MIDAKGPQRSAAGGRLGSAAAWIYAVCCLPYLVLKVLWTIDVPVGIADRSVFDESGWAAANGLMAVIQLAGLVLVLALTRPWARRVPAWLLLFPVWVGSGLLFHVAVGAVLVGLISPPSQASSGSTGFGEFQPWVFVVVYSAFAGQGAALAVAFACHVRARWGRLLGARTGEVLSRRTALARSWSENHLVQMAEAAAAMTFGVALVCLYWAVGGSFGLSDSNPHPSAGFQAARVVGAVIAGLGLLALAGRWGSRRRFWLASALTWVGSGAVAAFDGLLLVINKLFLVSGTHTSEPGWTVYDSLVMVKVIIGLLAAAVGVVAVTAAAKGNHVRSLPETSFAEQRRVRTPR